MAEAGYEHTELGETGIIILVRKQLYSLGAEGAIIGLRGHCKIMQNTFRSKFFHYLQNFESLNGR